jgi:hypothetical protein
LAGKAQIEAWGSSARKQCYKTTSFILLIGDYDQIVSSRTVGTYLTNNKMKYDFKTRILSRSPCPNEIREDTKAITPAPLESLTLQL